MNSSSSSNNNNNNNNKQQATTTKIIRYIINTSPLSVPINNEISESQSRILE